MHMEMFLTGDKHKASHNNKNIFLVLSPNILKSTTVIKLADQHPHTKYTYFRRDIISSQWCDHYDSICILNITNFLSVSKYGCT